MRKSSWTTSVRGVTGTVMAAATTLLAACDGGQVPVDAALAVSPQERSIRITELRDADGICRTDGSRFVDVPMLLRLTTGDGSPIRDADVEVYVDFAANTYSGRPVLALFEDRNGNGIVDADSELASGEGDSVARVTTDDDGAYRLLLRADIACPYRGEVFAWVAGTSATASFEVVAVETIEPESEAPEVPVPRPSDDEEASEAERGAEPGGDGEGTEGTVEEDGVPVPDVTDPFETGSPAGQDAPTDENAPGEGGETDVPAPQPVHCIDASGRRTAVVCTVDPERAS